MDKVIEIFIREPEKEFHVRGLARRLHKSPSTISKYLKLYEKKGILTSELRVNHLVFVADSENRDFKRIKLEYNLSQLFNSGLIDHLIEAFNFPEAIISFGSYAKAENTKYSDIDLLIISPQNKEINLAPYEKKLGYEIQIIVKSRKEIEIMKKNNRELLNNFINGYVLYGYWEVFS